LVFVHDPRRAVTRILPVPVPLIRPTTALASVPAAASARATSSAIRAGTAASNPPEVCTSRRIGRWHEDVYELKERRCGTVQARRCGYEADNGQSHYRFRFFGGARELHSTQQRLILWIIDGGQESIARGRSVEKITQRVDTQLSRPVHFFASDELVTAVGVI
jgi:hypothetical protein